jgi:hypothetical protein
VALEGWPTVEDLAAFLRVPVPTDPGELGVMTSALDAAIDYGNRRLNYAFDPADETLPALPPIGGYSCKQHAAKLYRRRDSTDGTIGFGDAGVVRVSGRDWDVENGYAALGPMVVG